MPTNPSIALIESDGVESLAISASWTPSTDETQYIVRLSLVDPLDSSRNRTFEVGSFRLNEVSGVFNTNFLLSQPFSGMRAQASLNTRGANPQLSSEISVGSLNDGAAAFTANATRGESTTVLTYGFTQGDPDGGFAADINGRRNAVVSIATRNDLTDAVGWLTVMAGTQYSQLDIGTIVSMSYENNRSPLGRYILFSYSYTDSQGFTTRGESVIDTAPSIPEPSITLAVSPASVLEDGSTNLVYTFTRTGDTSSALTVNYTVGGTATLGTDYTIFGALDRTATFAAGSSTTTITIRPTRDSTVELNETIGLTLASGWGYTIGTAGAVVGTITNDDIESGASTTLTGGQSTLTLTGTRRINGTGNELNNIITGNQNNNSLCGGRGKDVLTGGGTSDSDIFLYNSLTESLLEVFDVITDYNNTDRIQAPAAVAEEANILTSSRGSVVDLTPTAIASLLSESSFAANSVAAFTVSGIGGTFVAMNDGRAGFQADSDAIIHLQNYTISSQNFVDFL